MQRQKDQENVLGRAGVFLGALVPWWSRGHILVKIFTTMVVFIRKFPYIHYKMYDTTQNSKN